MPESVSFHTKGQLAQLMLQRAVESGVSFAWVAGDEVYGNDRKLRLWLERLDVPARAGNQEHRETLGFAEKGPRQIRADRLVSQVDAAGWSTISAGDGAKGPRVYDWTMVKIRPLWSRPKATGSWPAAALPNLQSWLTTCVWPSGNNLGGTGQGGRNPLGHRTECFEEAKGEVGLDEYEVRRWDGWYRHITLAMLAHAYLTVIRHQALEQGKKGATTVSMKS